MPFPADPEAALEQLLQAATDHHVAGRLDEALAGYSQILSRRPGHLVALHRLGVLALQVGQHEKAVELFRQVVTQDAGAWRSHCSLGQALASQGKHQEAMVAFRRAFELNPSCVEALVGLGGASRTLGLIQEAVAAFEKIVTLRPDHADAHNDLGVALQDAGRLTEAIAAFHRALALQEDYPVAHSNLGTALLLDRQTQQALDELRGTVTRWPEFADAWYNLGNAAFAANRFADSEAAYRKALQLAPGHIAAYNNLGNALQAMGRNEEALETYLRALKLAPDFVDTYNNASAAARTLGRMDEAVAFLKEALAKRPDFHITHCNLGNVLKDIGLMDEAVQSFRKALAINPSDTVTHSNLAYSVNFLPGFEAKMILEENLQWHRAHVPADWGRAAHSNDPDPGRRLRLGYVSPDFREHCQSLFTIPLLSHQDRSRFEIFAYAGVPRPDAITRRIAEHVDVWRDTAGLSDESVAALVRADRIDILVDLTMHMSNGRPLLFARKPAPVQVAWLAYPGTTGLAAMDYRLTDPYLDPPGEHDDWYTETSIRLPDTFWCYDPLTVEPLPGPLPALEKGYVTFGSLNNFCKVTVSTLKVWAQVLSGVPQARLLLLAQPGGHRQRVLGCLAQEGITQDRIEFAAFRPRAEYLALHQQVDLGLDTLPYNGHTTSLDAFWMGVPVVTRLGDTVVGRAGWSQLCNLGLRELAATHDEAFVRIAVDLAGDLPRLARLRAELRPRMASSPLMDGNRFARNLEVALRQMWQRWCEQRKA
jgi:predicted O-linked N-acetylglucosamine transferase (SPINDLY family)